jgi:hypothetical protein
MQEEVPRDELWFDIVRSINNPNGLDEQYGKYEWLQDFRSVDVELQLHEARRLLSRLIRQFKHDPSHVIEVLQQLVRDAWVQDVAFWVSTIGFSQPQEEQEAYAACWAYIDHGLEKLTQKVSKDQFIPAQREIDERELSLEPRHRRWPAREPLQHSTHPTGASASFEANTTTMNTALRFQEEFFNNNRNRPFHKLA